MITLGQELANKNLDTYSALFIGGGNTFKLLAELKSSGVFEKIREFNNNNNNGIVFGGSAGAIIFSYDLEACLCDDINEIGLEDTKGFDTLNGYSLLCHYTNRSEEKDKNNTDYLLQLSYKRKSIALSEEDTIFINGANIENIGNKDYYVFENGKCRKNLL